MKRPKTYFSFDTVIKLCREMKASGKRICFTHGAYDLFHYSHLDLLKKSAAVSDFLVVGVDSDNSVSKYKSYKRPIISQDYRLQIIASLDIVDAVFIKDTELDKDEHTLLYKTIMPDFISIGQKYHFEEDIKKEAIKAGTEVIKFDTFQEPSTTSIINKIINKYSRAYNTSDLEDVPKEII